MFPTKSNSFLSILFESETLIFLGTIITSFIKGTLISTKSQIFIHNFDRYFGDNSPSATFKNKYLCSTMPYKTGYNTTIANLGNSPWMISGGTRYYIDGLDVSGTNFNLFYAGLQNSGYENLESVSTGGFSASSGNAVPDNLAASANYIYFNSRIRTNFVRAVTRINQGFSCRFNETEDNMYYLQWREKFGGVGTFPGRQNDLSNDETLLTSSLILKYYEDGYYNSPSWSGDATNGGGSWWSDAYNSAIGRMVVPDFLSIGVGFNGIAGVGGGTSIEFRWVTHGPEASWKPMITVTQSVGGGYSVDATINIELANYIGNVNNITRSMMQTKTPNGDIPTFWGSGGAAAGGKIGVTAYVTPNVGGSFIIGRELNLGVGLPAGPLPANGAGGVSNTWILYDFYN